MAEWKARGEDTDYGRIIAAATESSLRSIVPVDDPQFTNPASMEEAIQNYCRQHNLEVPQTQGEFMRCVTESLAFRYKQGIDDMNKCIPAPIKQLNIIGGGCQNQLLNQLTANALGIPVCAGPVEATAIGNILMQAKAMGEVTEISDLKAIVTNSVEPKVFQPQ